MMRPGSERSAITDLPLQCVIFFWSEARLPLVLPSLRS